MLERNAQPHNATTLNSYSVVVYDVSCREHASRLVPAQRVMIKCSVLLGVKSMRGQAHVHESLFSSLGYQTSSAVRSSVLGAIAQNIEQVTTGRSRYPMS